MTSTVHFVSLGIRDDWSMISRFTELAQRSGLGDRIVVDPAEADHLVVCDLHNQPRLSVRRSVAERYGSRALARTVCYDERDHPYPEFPGLFVSMPVRCLDGASMRPWAYPPTTLNGRVVPAVEEPEFLVSFVGSPTHPVRESLFALTGDGVLIRRIDGFTFHRRDRDDDEEIRASYATDLMSSAFVLCPRGHGPASIRLFETMRAGRVPVIVSDDWAEPVGPDWQSFSIRVPECDAASVVDICRERSDEAAEMGRRSALEYGRWFSEEVYMSRLLDLVDRLQPRLPRSVIRVRAPLRARHIARTVRNRCRPGGR